MSNKIVFIPIGQHYPFSSPHTQSTSPTQIQKVIPFNSQSKATIKEQIGFLKVLGLTHLVGLLSAKEEPEAYTVNFEYVPTKFELNLQHYPDQLAEKIQTQLLQLTERLALLSIDHKFDLDNVGLDSNNDVKYYLGFDFRIDSKTDREEAVLNYQQQLETIFEIERPMRRKSARETCYHETMDTCKETPYQLEQMIFIDIVKKNISNAATNRPERRFIRGGSPCVQPNQPTYTAKEEKKVKKKSVDTINLKHSLIAKIDKIKCSLKELTDKNSYKIGPRLTCKDNNHNFNQIINNLNQSIATAEPSANNLGSLMDHYQNQKQSTFSQLCHDASKTLQQENKKEHTKSHTSLQPPTTNNQKDYLALASRDSYRNEFIQLLQSDPLSSQQDSDLKPPNFPTKQPQVKPPESKDKNQHIKTRMRRALNSSVKLLSSLRPKQPVHFQ